jgi:hypothetical protein
MNRTSSCLNKSTPFPRIDLYAPSNCVLMRQEFKPLIRQATSTYFIDQNEAADTHQNGKMHKSAFSMVLPICLV